MLEIAMDYIAGNEGFCGTVYEDSLGIPTIGYGFNMLRANAPKQLERLGYDHKRLMQAMEVVSREDALKLMEDDVRVAISDAKSLVARFDQFNIPRRVIVADMAFNLGFNRFSRFEKTLAALDRNDYNGAALEMMDSKWFQQVKGRAHRNAVGMVAGELIFNNGAKHGGHGEILLRSLQSGGGGHDAGDGGTP